MKPEEIEQQVDAIHGLLMALTGQQAAHSAAMDALLIALHQRDPDLLPLFQQHLRAIAPLSRCSLQPEQEQPYDSYIAELLHNVSQLLPR